MSWRPLLEGADADRAREAIAAIAADLAADVPATADLDRGLAGRALLHACLARDGEAAAIDRAAEALEQALDGMGRLSNPWLLEGLSGVAWTAAHLGDVVELDAETMEVLDQLVAESLAHEKWPFEWEYVAGLIGPSVYALERPGRAGEALCSRVVAHLAALAERHPAGITWRSPPRMLSPEEMELNRDGYYNLGLAHGVVGVIGFLARAVDTPGARELLEGAVGWLCAHDTGSPASRFPYGLIRGRDDAGPRRDGWCYGDLAAGLTLIRAGLAASHSDWIEHGLSVAREVVGREPDDLETSMCHGTTGRAHLFNRMAQATGDALLAEAARDWYRATLARRQPGRGIGGYRAERGPGLDGSLLLGAAGVALGLLAAVSPVEPAWDRALLIDLPPTGARPPSNYGS